MADRASCHKPERKYYKNIHVCPTRYIHYMYCIVYMFAKCEMSSWETLTTLAVPRCYANLVNVQGRLYLVGGRSPVGRKIISVDTVERYHLDTDQWQMFATLRGPRHDAACTAVGLSARRVICLLHTNVVRCLLSACYCNSTSGTNR